MHNLVYKASLYHTVTSVVLQFGAMVQIHYSKLYHLDNLIGPSKQNVQLCHSLAK